MRATHAENTPLSLILLAHREHQPSLVVDQFVGRQLPLRVVAAARRPAPTTHWLLSRVGQKLRHWRGFCAALPALATTSPSSIAAGPTRSGESGLSCGPGWVDHPRPHRRAVTRSGRSWAGRPRRQAFRSALHAPRRCERRRALVASSRLRLPLLLSMSNPLLEAAPTAALPRRQLPIGPLRPRSTVGLRCRHRRRPPQRICLRQRQLLVKVHDQAVYLDGARAGAAQRTHRSSDLRELVLGERPRPSSTMTPRPHAVSSEEWGGTQRMSYTSVRVSW